MNFLNSPPVIVVLEQCLALVLFSGIFLCNPGFHACGFFKHSCRSPNPCELGDGSLAKFGVCYSGYCCDFPLCHWDQSSVGTLWISLPVAGGGISLCG